MKKYIIKPILGIVILVLFTVLFYFLFKDVISLDNLEANKLYLQNLVDQYYFQSVLIYLGLFAVIIATSLPLVAPLAVAGGYLYGVIPGLIYSDIGATFGGISAFLLLRNFLKGFIEKRYGSKYSLFRERLHKKGTRYLLLLQLLCIIPFFIINIIAVLADVSVFTLFWIIAVGSIPFLLVNTIAGDQLRSIETVQDIFSPMIIFVLLLLLIVILSPILIRRIKGKNNNIVPL